MSIDELQTICSRLKGVTEDIKWEDHLCFTIGGKMFLVTAPDRLPHSASFKVTEKDFGELTAWEGFIPAPYLARHQWVQVDDINRLGSKEWNYYIQQSYQLIAAGLPVKIKKQIGL
ncbi:MAG: MmcQ/YjbR family DNA-binding protein [Chitinophagaceae bacterium]